MHLKHLVYTFLKIKKDIPIYIGKAINIKRRLSNYGNLPKLPRRLQKNGVSDG